MNAEAYIKKFKMMLGMRAIISLFVGLLFIVFILELVSSGMIYYFYSYQATRGAVEADFKSKEFSETDSEKLKAMLDERAARFAASSTPAFIRLFH